MDGLRLEIAYKNKPTNNMNFGNRLGERIIYEPQIAIDNSSNRRINICFLYLSSAIVFHPTSAFPLTLIEKQ